MEVLGKQVLDTRDTLGIVGVLETLAPTQQAQQDSSVGRHTSQQSDRVGKDSPGRHTPGSGRRRNRVLGNLGTGQGGPWLPWLQSAYSAANALRRVADVELPAG